MSEDKKQGKKDKRSIEMLRKLLRKKEAEIEKIGKELERRRHGRLGQDIRDFSDLNPDDVLLVEEVGGPEDTDDFCFYLINGESPVLIRKTNHRGRYSGIIRFLEEEVKPVEVHEHVLGLEHRVWKLTGPTLLAVRELERGGVGRIYRRRGWRGVKEALDKLRDIQENPLAGGFQFGRTGALRHLFRRELPHLLNISERAVKYSIKNDLKVEEAISALSLEDEEFAVEYGKARKKLQKIVEEWEKSFGPYLPS